eukprot:4163645-Prymnesium_polylepis.1
MTALRVELQTARENVDAAEKARAEFQSASLEILSKASSAPRAAVAGGESSGSSAEAALAQLEAIRTTYASDLGLEPGMHRWSEAAVHAYFESSGEVRPVHSEELALEEIRAQLVPAKAQLELAQVELKLARRESQSCTAAAAAAREELEGVSSKAEKERSSAKAAKDELLRIRGELEAERKGARDILDAEKKAAKEELQRTRAELEAEKKMMRDTIEAEQKMVRDTIEAEKKMAKDQLQKTRAELEAEKKM